MNILYNHARRLRSGWRFAVFAIVFMMLFVIFGGVAAVLLKAFSPAMIVRILTLTQGSGEFLVQGALILFIATVGGFVCLRLLEDLPFRALGWGLHRSWFKDLLFGSIIGAASLLFAALIITVFGGFSFSFNREASGAAITQTIVVTTLIFVLGAAGEEAWFRGYILQTLLRSHPVLLAAIPSSILFAALHLGNPNVAPFWTFINTALAGVWLAVAYLRTRSLWFPLGVHWAWNWTMASVLGIPVSGITSIAPAPLFRATETGADWLTGGSYGIEGGAVCTLALIVSSLFIWKTSWLKADEELLMMTSRENPQNTVFNELLTAETQSTQS